MKYFNVNLREKKDGMTLTRDNYVKVNNKSSIEKGRVYSDEWCEKHKNDCLKNYDLNIKYLKKLDAHEFDLELEKFLKLNPDFFEITDLNQSDCVEGYYLLVLNDYCQFYLGTSGNIKKRIMNHWSRTKQFDRLIFGTIENSTLSIDSFRAFDTKKIYIMKSKEIFFLENDIIKNINKKFILNRTDGGLLVGGLNEAIKKQKFKDIN